MKSFLKIWISYPRDISYSFLTCISTDKRIWFDVSWILVNANEWDEPSRKRALGKTKRIVVFNETKNEEKRTIRRGCSFWWPRLNNRHYAPFHHVCYCVCLFTQNVCFPPSRNGSWLFDGTRKKNREIKKPTLDCRKRHPLGSSCRVDP